MLPENFASHIYYEIRPEYRNKGYGMKILELGLEEARKIGLKEVILTTKKDNLASKKIIETNGGLLADECMTSEGLYLKYVINLEK
jgi:predicted acetyltransferase